MHYSRFNTIITFDLHDVVFTFDYKKILHILWTTDRKWPLITTIAYPRFIWNFIKLLRQKPSDYDIFILFSEQRPVLVPVALDLMSAIKVIPETVQIIQELSDKEYTLHILTNATEIRLLDIRKKYAHLLRKFRYCKGITTPSNPLGRKPHALFFHEYLDKAKKLAQTDFPLKNVIFIDDNKENIKTAQKVGMKAIHFQSPQQLREALVELGILP